MRFQEWIKIDRSTFFRKAKVKYRQFRGAEPRLSLDIDLPTENYSDWKVVPALLNENDIVYSFGICDDIGFELLACERKVNLFAFDPTPYSIDWIDQQLLPSSFQFYPWAASGSDRDLYLYPRIDRDGKKSSVMFTFHEEASSETGGVKVKSLSLQSITKKFGHKNVDVLKMDIEGAEYEVIDHLLNSHLLPKMILIEFHHRFEGIGIEKTVEAIEGLRVAGYLLASVSLNNTEVCFVHESVIGNQ